MSKVAPYGTWPSQLTADVIVQSASSVVELVVDPATSKIYHIESRPSEGGRNVLVQSEEGKDVFGKDWNCRTAVHEYGGAPAVVCDDKVYFSNFSDGRVYTLDATSGEEPKPVTPESKAHRYADLAVHPWYRHLLVAIQEDHTKPAPADVVNTLCLINTKTQQVATLVSGADFYGAPCFSPDGAHLAWQQWDHPDMPWEGGQVYIAGISADDKEIRAKDVRHIAGRAGAVSAGYPLWTSNDSLVFTSDESGYQNPWIYTVSAGKAAPVLQTPVKEDFSSPAWRFGSAFGAVADNEGKMALYTALRDGRSVLYMVSLHCGTLEEIECPYTVVECVYRIVDRSMVFIGGKDDAPKSIVLCTLKDYAKPKYAEVKAAKRDLPEWSVSKPLPMTLEVPPNKDPLYIVLYPPTSSGYKGPENELPPCIVNVHGGPTGMADQSFTLPKQFFTSRGFAWVDVNYGGSAGYGREYINRLAGTWGVVDVRDCVLAASILSKTHKLIDPARTAIRGGSSGGFTVLAAACAYPDAFAAAVSNYGISDLFKLCEFTHKFESHYMEKLLGGTPDQIPEVYKERSPVFNADKIRTPLLILQGSLDAVVPPGQAEAIVKAIKDNNGRVDYVLFEGEGHGFRKSENMKAALEKELAFYEDVFGLKKHA
ncbi:hypothetical protein EIP86_009315 [Pleurotus ostreatoroseus]|nr:hypothetical protein EIP86_009315 [Pleurotus ostreatoroseus]